MLTKRERRALLAFAKHLRKGAAILGCDFDIANKLLHGEPDEHWICTSPRWCGHTAESLAYEGTAVRR